MSRCHLRVGEVVREALRDSVDRFFEHEAGIRSGAEPEDVHQARVATRRLRSDAKTFSHFLDAAWTAELRAELRRDRARHAEDRTPIRRG